MRIVKSTIVVSFILIIVFNKMNVPPHLFSLFPQFIYVSQLALNLAVSNAAKLTFPTKWTVFNLW